MNIANQYNYTFPSYALSALINGDVSGIDREDQNNLTEFLERECYVDYWDVKRDENGEALDSYFSSWPEFGLACDCVNLIGIVWER